MCDKCALSIPVTILLGCSGFGDAVDCIDTADIDYNQEVMSMGTCLRWNDATVCGGRV